MSELFAGAGRVLVESCATDRTEPTPPRSDFVALSPSRWPIPSLAIVALLCVAAPARSARLHVMAGGERTTGASTADDWSLSNCYPSLAAAASVAGSADSLLLSREDHALAELIAVPALLANRDLDTDPVGCRILVGDGGGLSIDTTAGSVELRGVEVAAEAQTSALPAVRVLAPAVAGTEVRIEACVFRGLQGAESPTAGGAAVNAVGGAQRVVVRLHDSVFEDCSAGGPGGAVFAGDGVDLVVDGCTLLRNEARFAGSTVYGGAIAVIAGAAGSTLTIENSTIAESISWGPGGGVYAQDAPLILRDTEVRDSRSAFGGVTNWGAGAGVFLRRAGSDPDPIALIAERCQFVGNRGDLALGTGAGDGGGLMIRGSDTSSPVVATISDCVFQDNFSDQGAGLYVGRGVNATIERSYFLDNTARSNGGGAYKGGALDDNIGETAFFSYCVFAGNRAGWDQNDQPIAFGGFGGAFMVRLNPRAEFQNCTFADNLSGPNGNRGDAIFVWNQGLAITDERQRSRLVNCLFYGASGNGQQVLVEFRGLTEAVNCAWEPGQLVAILAPTPQKVELDGSPFSSAGEWTLAELSPCIDAGITLDHTTDIDGAFVPSGFAPDIGAFEAQITVSTPSRSGTLRLHPIWPNPANPHAVVAFTLVRAGSVRLTVHDVAGRQVAVLADAWMSGGEHRVVWNGRDERGAATASGLYLVKLATANGQATQKMMLVR